MKTKRIVWTVVFLGITLTAIVMEVVAGIFHPGGTIPWTEYLAKYVPWPVQLAAYVILAVWLPFHFWRHDHLRKAAFTAGVREGQQAARTRYAEMLHVQARTHAVTELRPGLAKAALWLIEDGRTAAGSPGRVLTDRLGLTDAAGNNLATALGIAPRGVCPTCRQDLG